MTTAGFASQLRELVRYELLVALRTRRLWLVGLFYLGSALVAGVGFLYAVRAIEVELQEALAQGGGAAAGVALSLLRSSAYEQLVSTFAGVPFSELAPALASSVVMPLFFAGSLFFLPTLIVLTTYDQVSAEVQSRAVVFSALRAPRRVLLLGKLVAQLLFFVALSALAALVLSLVTVVMLDTVALADVLSGLARVWVVLIPYGAVFLGLSLCCSSFSRQPSTALYAAFGSTFLLSAMGWTSAFDPDGPYGWLRELHRLSPSAYVPGLWRAGVFAPLTSALALLAIAGAFVALALWRFERVDL